MYEVDGRLTLTGKIPFYVRGAIALIKDYKKFSYVIHVDHAKVDFNSFCIKVFWGVYDFDPLWANPALIYIENFSEVKAEGLFYIVFARPPLGNSFGVLDSDFSLYMHMIFVDNMSHVEVSDITIASTNNPGSAYGSWTINKTPIRVQGGSIFVSTSNSSSGRYRGAKMYNDMPSGENKGFHILENGIVSIGSQGLGLTMSYHSIGGASTGTGG